MNKKNSSTLFVYLITILSLVVLHPMFATAMDEVQGVKSIDKPLVIVFEGGCSASTAVNRFMEKIILAHGLTKYQKAHFEYMHLTVKWKNKRYHQMVQDPQYSQTSKEDILIDTIKMAKREAKELGQVFYFKASAKYLLRQSFKEKMNKVGVTYVGVYRPNVIDRCICLTRDCLHGNAGFPVFQNNGTRTDLCFARRRVDAPIVANFENPKECLKMSSYEKKLIKDQSFPSVSSERLFEFEYSDSDEAWNRSIEAWVVILRPVLKDLLNETSVMEVLREFRGLRSPHLPHTELVYNYDYLVDEVKGTIWEHQLRLEEEKS